MSWGTPQTHTPIKLVLTSLVEIRKLNDANAYSMFFVVQTLVHCEVFSVEIKSFFKLQLTSELFLIFISHFQKSKTQKIVGCIQIFLSDMGTLWNDSLYLSQCLNLTSLEIHYLQLTTKNCSIWSFPGWLLLPKTCFGQRCM